VTPLTLIIDRQFRGVGRLKVRSGTMNEVVRRKINEMLDELFDAGRLEILRAIREQEVYVMEVYSAFRAKQLDKLVIGPTARPIAIAMKSWIDKLVTDGPSPDYSPKHKEAHETSRRVLEKARGAAKVADVASVLEELRESAWARKHPRSFNMTRSSVLSFIRSTLKRSHPLWLAVAAVEKRRVKKATKRTPLTVEQMRNFFPHPETDWLDAIAWGMATTGMGGKEYWGRWNVLADRVHIAGTKTAHRTTDSRVRDVPLIWTPAVPKFNRRKFEDDLRTRTRSITVYDLRRTYATWLEAAGIIRARRITYLGHSRGDVTGLYEQHEVDAYLADDAQKLRAFLKLPHTVSHPLTLNKGKSA
jgi:integrase